MLNCFVALEGSTQLKLIRFYKEEKLDKLVPKLSKELNKRKSAEAQTNDSLFLRDTVLPLFQTLAYYPFILHPGLFQLGTFLPSRVA